MTGPIIAQCGFVTLTLRQDGPGLWDILHGGVRVGYVVRHGATEYEAFTNHTATTRPTVEEAVVALARLLQDLGFVPNGTGAR